MKISEKHYTVCTPNYTHYYGYWDPPENFSDCATVIAPNKRQAKIKAVRALREEGSDWFEPDKSPYAKLEVIENGCPHGNCWCDLCSALPDWSECDGCQRQWEDECEHEWKDGLISRSGAEAVNETYCNICLLSKEEYESRISQ